MHSNTVPHGPVTQTHCRVSAIQRNGFRNSVSLAPKQFHFKSSRRSLSCTAVDRVDHHQLCDADGTDDNSGIVNFCMEVSTAVGQLTIRALQDEDMRGAAYVLTRSFAGTPGGLPFDDVSEYVEDMLSAPPRGVLLVGRIRTTDDGKERVIGTAALSFTPDTRERFPSLQPPEHQALLCNMAVEPKFRRQGIAKLLLTAAEEVTRRAGRDRIYLHVRLVDEVAAQLYYSMNYQEDMRDSWLVTLRNIIPRALLYKCV